METLTIIGFYRGDGSMILHFKEGTRILHLKARSSNQECLNP